MIFGCKRSTYAKSGEFIIEDGIILNDSQKLIHEDINGSTTLCVCDYNGENKNPIYTFPDNYYDYSLATDGELVFSGGVKREALPSQPWL